MEPDYNGSPAVEIDEAHIMAAHGQAICLFGIYDRRAKNSIIWTIGYDRSKRKLNPLLRKYVDPGFFNENGDSGTRVFSDGWKAYKKKNIEAIGQYT